jgi:EAL domain-containing protein (putative c-di-GMP-specific phosphodiesterase class I)
MRPAVPTLGTACPAQAAAVLQALRAMGVEIALDDFGTGHSSLSSVSEFPLSVLKLDRAFLASDRSEERCAMGQGYRFSRPVPAEALTALLSRSASLRAGVSPR